MTGTVTTIAAAPAQQEPPLPEGLVARGSRASSKPTP